MIVQFQTMDGDLLGPQIDLPVNSTRSQLEMIVNELNANEEKSPFAFYINETEIIETVAKTITEQVKYVL